MWIICLHPKQCCCRTPYKSSGAAKAIAFQWAWSNIELVIPQWSSRARFEPLKTDTQLVIEVSYIFPVSKMGYVVVTDNSSRYFNYAFCHKKKILLGMKYVLSNFTNARPVEVDHLTGRLAKERLIRSCWSTTSLLEWKSNHSVFVSSWVAL